MRRERFFRMAQSEAETLLAAAPTVQLAATTASGAPLLRTLHSVVVDGALCFHAAPVGEKREALGRHVVIAAEEIVASIPSWFVDERAACPATTLYRSVQLHGTLAAIERAADKARVLQALMEKYQPEGGHARIDAATSDFSELYQKQVDAIWIGCVPLAHLDGKAKLAQNRSPEERARLCEKLWARGAPGDARAIELVRAANPDMPTPAFLRTRLPLTLHCALEARDVDAAVELLAFEYWNVDEHPRARIAGAIAGSTAFVGARDGDGRLVACARALADGHKYAWIYDVVVAPPWRRAGLGAEVVRLLLDHPSVRGAAAVWLRTRDAQPFYRKLGFVDAGELPPKSYTSTNMVRTQAR